jgi:hypothetical protein
LQKPSSFGRALPVAEARDYLDNSSIFFAIRRRLGLLGGRPSCDRLCFLRDWHPRRSAQKLDYPLARHARRGIVSLLQE